MRNESEGSRSARFGAVTAAIPLLGLATAMATPDDEVEFFERRIRPLLVENCFECHADATGTTKGGLALDSKPGWARGGDSGPAIVPGQIDQSLLMRAVKYADAEVHMPPRGKLPEESIRDLETWIAMGAPDPREQLPIEKAPEKETIDLDAGRAHWAFRPILDVEPPSSTRSAGWVRDPIDSFVLAELESRSLEPAREAGRRDWLRRVSFDLTGLPPTRDEIEAFENDTGANAHERVVDRLLASPRHGERFARFWLDLARYSDSNGVDENLAFGSAWRYRDYVVRSFNDDKSFDRFVIEQLAGDLLPEPTGSDESARAALHDQIVATGFLALGPRMLAEQDKEKLVVDTIDEQIDVISKTFLGVTLACARCHDHKFDPFSQRDYYALAGILRSTSSFDDLGFLSKWRERELASRAEIEARDAWRKEREAAANALAQVTERGKRTRRIELLRSLQGTVEALGPLAEKAKSVAAESFTDSNLRIDRSNYGTEDVPLIHTHQAGQQFAEYRIELPTTGRHALRVRYASGEKRPLRVLVDGNPISERALDATTGGFRVEHLSWSEPLAFDAATSQVTIRFERVHDEPQHFPHLSSFVIVPDIEPSASSDTSRDEAFAQSVLSWLAAGGDRASAALAARVADALETHADEKSPLADASLEAARRALVGNGGPIGAQALDDSSRFPADLRAEHEAGTAMLAALDARKPPDFERAMAVADDQAIEMPLHIRGSHLNKEANPVPRSAPSLFDSQVALEPIEPGRSGRLEFARWLVDPRNPLTARVIVNRVWGWHFGNGLSRSPSNVGLRGEPPTHPELLDYLAREFMNDGWSLKRLHRRIVLSSTYRMSTVADDTTLERDPENRAISRFPRRRLDAEQLRDSMLFVSGALDEKRGGTLLGTKDREYVTNDQSNNGAQYDVPRRTIYLPIIRNAMFDYLATFDYADPSTPLEQRPQSVVASQALWLMNSPFVIDQATRIAREILADPTLGSDDAARVNAAYSRVLARSATPRESERAGRFLEVARANAGEGDANERALAALCQALFACSEFLHVE